MTPARIIEIALYEILSLLPYLLLLLYMFREHLRLPTTLSFIAVGAFVLLRCGWNVAAHAGLLDRTFPFPLITYSLLTILFFKTHFGKSLFAAMMLLNAANFVTTAAKCLEGVLFPIEAAQMHRWTNLLTLCVVEAVVLIPLFFYIRRIFKPALTADISGVSWRLLWCIPLTFYVVWYRNYYFSAEGAEVLALRPRHTLFCFLVNAGAMLIYTMVAMLINEYTKNAALREREHVLTMQHTQYANLQDRIEEARRAKHDLRQHLRVLSAYAKDGKYDELAVYLERYRATVPEDETFSFCDHLAVNALLQYFAGYAKAIGAGFAATVHIPSELGIPDEVLAVVLGNLLENAMDAAVAEGSGAVISVRGKSDEGTVFFKIRNTCNRPPKTDRNGNYISTKAGTGHGIGISSVSEIVHRYNGLMEIRHEDGVFTVSVMLNVP